MLEDFRQWLLGLDAQMLAVLAILIGDIMALFVLQGLKDQRSGAFPCKDYSFLTRVPKLNAVILLTVALYFAYLAYVNYIQSDKNAMLLKLLVANLLIAVAGVIKLDTTFFRSPDTLQLEEEVELLP